MSNELDMGNAFNEWVDFFQEGYDIYSLNNEIDIKNTNENYFSFKDDKVTKETKKENFVIETINNFNINTNSNKKVEKEEIEVLNTEEEDKNVIHHDTQSNEVSDKIRLENEIKELNEKLKMYKAKIPKPPIHPKNNNKTRNKKKEMKGNNSYVKQKKTNFINLDIIKENTYENMYKGKSRRLVSSNSSSSLNTFNRTQQMPMNITNTRITNYHIVNHINVNNNDDLCDIERRLKEYMMKDSSNHNTEKGTNRLVPSGCESKSNRIIKEKEENINEDVSTLIERYNMAKRMKKKRNKVSIDDFIKEKKNRKEIEIKIENSNHQIEYKPMYEEELSPIHKQNIIDVPVIEKPIQEEEVKNVHSEDKMNNNLQGELTTISEVKKENSYIDIKQVDTKTKNKLPPKKNNDDTIPFHLIDKEKIYKNLVKYMYGKVPLKKSKRNKSTQH